MRWSLVATLSLVMAAGACTSLLGDFTLGTTGAADAGPDGTMMEAGPQPEGGEDGPSVMVTAKPVAANVYLGTTATLDGTQSTATQGGLTYSWSLLTHPTGSTVGDGSIGAANMAVATIKPDVVGEYEFSLQVTSTTDPSVNNTATVTLYCGLPQVFYAQGTGGTTVTASYNVANLNGMNAHPIMCPDKAPGDPLSGADIPPYASGAGRAYDFWEAPPLDPMVTDGGGGPGSHVAAFTIDYTGGNYTTHLWGASSTSACDAGTTDYTATGFGPGRPYGSVPRFRPDGQRFAVFDSSWNILTYAWGNTSGTNNVAAYPVSFQLQQGSVPGLDPSTAVGADGGILQYYFQEPPSIEWMGTSVDGGATAWQVAWAAPHPTGTGAMGWELVTAPDQSHATPTTYMECPGVVPRQFAILSDGTVIASYRQTPTGAEDLVHLMSMNGTCMAITNYTNLSPQLGSIATDFSISPAPAGTPVNSLVIAFLRFDAGSDSAASWSANGATLPGGYVYTVPVGGGMLTRLANAPAIFGPRWIGGGTQIVFTRLDGVTSAGNLATSVVTVLPGGGTPSVVVQGDGMTTFVSTSGNAACDIGPGTAARGGAGLIALVGVAGLVRRRRRL